jgi:hypothetical protein
MRGMFRIIAMVVTDRSDGRLDQGTVTLYSLMQVTMIDVET